MGFKEDMAKFQRYFKMLEREYEQFFSGALNKPPWDTLRVVDDIVKTYARNPPRNLSEQSIFAMHQAKYNTYTEMWNRRLRLKEEGRLPGGPEMKSRRSASPPPPEPASRPSSEGRDSLRKVFDSYVAAKQKAGEGTGKLNYESFRRTLEKQAEQLRSSRGFKDVNFGVSVKDGKVSVVARPKKKRP